MEGDGRLHAAFRGLALEAAMVVAELRVSKEWLRREAARLGLTGTA
jgi:hypothetical protein